jgi:hypothetical protein
MATEVTVSSGPTELIQTADAIQVYMMMELAPGVLFTQPGEPSDLHARARGQA